MFGIVIAAILVSRLISRRRRQSGKPFGFEGYERIFVRDC